jgi:hypothetical protein
MNLLLLPKELQVLISEFNVQHRPVMRLVMNELLVKYKERTNNDKYCLGCGDLSDKQYFTYIYWRKYSFCGALCRYDIEYIMRRNRR